MSQKPFSRTVQNLGNGCRGVSLPSGWADAQDVDEGDELVIEEWDDDSGTITFSTR